MMVRRELTDTEQEERSRLRSLWEEKKGQLHLTQKKAAEELGFSNQTAISQYLNGRIPLNLETVMKFCKLLDVKVEEISPRYAEMVPTQQSAVPRVRVKDPTALIQVVAGNNVLAPDVRAGDVMVIDQNDLSGCGLSLPTGRIVAVFTTSKQS